MDRRRFLKTVGAGGAAATVSLGGYAHFIEPQRLTVTHALTNTPRALRMVQISDLHLRHISNVHEKIAGELASLKPDLLILSGDIIDKDGKQPLVEEFLQLLPRGPQVLATLGNWEHWSHVNLSALRKLYEQHNVQLLVNESVEVKSSARTLRVTGLDDWTAGNPDYKGAVRHGIPDICVAHSPYFRDVLIETARRDPSFPRIPSIMLSGHTHGGQVRLGPIAPVRPHGSGRYLEGWYRDAWPWLFVSRGVGTSVLPFRFNAPPELVVFDL
jgi:predicted MPP superfamily phosphohydrolase